MRSDRVKHVHRAALSSVDGYSRSAKRSKDQQGGCPNDPLQSALAIPGALLFRHTLPMLLLPERERRPEAVVAQAVRERLAVRLPDRTQQTPPFLRHCLQDARNVPSDTLGSRRRRQSLLAGNQSRYRAALLAADEA